MTDDLDRVLCGYHLASIRPDSDRLDGEFLYRALSAPTLARQFSVAATGVTRYGISKQAIRTAVFPLPPREEQRQICQRILTELAPIDSSVESAHREIALIREYRTRLIADVVTGKLDVRDVAPESVEPPFDGLDDALEEDDSAEDDLADVDRRGPNVEADNDDE